MELVIEVITALRNIRGEMNVPPGEQIDALLRTKDREIEERLQRNQSFIQNLARVKNLRIGEEVEKPAYSAFAVVRDVEIFVPMDRSRMEEEARRLQKEIAKIEKEIAFVGRNFPMNSSSRRRRGRSWIERRRRPCNIKPSDINWRRV